MSTEERTRTPDTQEVRDAPVTTTQQRAGTAATLLQKRLLGWGLLALAFLFAYLFLVFWPGQVDKNSTGNSPQTVFLLGRYGQLVLSLDVRLILMVMMAGGLGSFVHVATSFSDYVGNEKLTSNWLWFYVLRPFIGMMLAVIFYLAIRGGFLTGGGDAGSINPFGIAALAGLVGMFSKQATDKLSEVFDTLFKTAPGAGDSKRKDNLNNPVPVLTDVEPKNVKQKSADVVVTVKGSGFVKGASLRVKDSARETEFVDATRLTARLLPADVASAGVIEVTVFNPGPGGGTSTPIKITIDPEGDGGGGGGGQPLPGGGGQPTPGGDAPAPGGGAAPPSGGAAGSVLNATGEHASVPEPKFLETPDAPDAASEVDACDVEITDADATPDEELPVTEGGVV
jgi:hypothetical protein